MPRGEFNNIPKAIAAVARSASAAVEETTRETHTRIHEQWDQGRDALGRPWQPLAPETVRQKGNTRILYDEGEMKESVQYRVDRTRLTGEVYSESPILPYHEFGVAERGLPRRPILGPAGEYAVRTAGETFESELDSRMRRIL